MQSFKKNGYSYGDKILVFYPANSYFTNEYESANKQLAYLGIKFLSFDKIDVAKTVEFTKCINEYKPDFLVIFRLSYYRFA